MSGPAHPNYLVRRVAAALLAVAALVGVVSAAGSVVAGFGGAPAAAAEAQPHQLDQWPSRHVAQPGDTLWNIAATYRGSVDQSRYVDALIRLNGGTSIEVGQAVRLP